MTSNFRNRAIKAVLALAVAGSMGACSSFTEKDTHQILKNFGDYLNFRNSMLDPSQVGRFDKAMPWGWSKPVTWPILEKLDMIDEPNEHWTAATDPLPSDLVVEQKEFILGEGDVINVSVFELVTPGLPYNEQKVVNEEGKVTLQNIGQIKVAGKTSSELEQFIGDEAVRLGFLLKKGQGSPGPQVSVQLVQSRARVFSALGQVANPGTYNIIGTDFRLLDALSLARDVAGGNQPGMDYLYVIRPVKGAGVTHPAEPGTQPASTNPLKSIDDATTKPSAATPAPQSDGPVFLHPIPQVLTMADVPDSSKMLAQVTPLDAAISGPSPLALAASPAPQASAATAPAPTAPTTDPGSAIDATKGAGKAYINGQWVDVAPNSSGMSAADSAAAAAGMGLPRVIRIPIVKLKEGDSRYNIVILPGDIINVPNIEPGEFYLMGHIVRPGVYSLTGRKVTLKQAVAAAGGLDATAIPRRCDLIRRIGNTEVTVQVDLQRVFDGDQPDIFLKANDMINVGTDMLATFLAVTRNAYRASYGWGYTYDRNLYNQPVINQSAP